MKEKTVKNVMAVGGAFASLLKLLLGLKNSDFFFKFNKKAFTLAEVLVTLTIIGVVSSMTIPTLHQRHTEQATVNKVKKFYSTASQAYQKAVVEYGDIDTWGVTGATKEDALIIYNNMIKNNFKIMVDCGFENTKKCVYDGFYKHFNGTGQVRYDDASYANYYKMLLNDGSSVWIRGDKDQIINFFIDVNGAQKPNQWGKDLFGGSVLNGKFLPGGTPGSLNEFDKTCKKSGTGFGCAAWVVYKGNMDYLHCDDLSWNGKQKCGK